MRTKDIICKINKVNSGFSLIEVLIAIMILLILSGALIGLFTWSFSAIISAGERSEELFFAQGSIETDIAEGVGGTGQNLVISFSGSDYSVWGRTIEEDSLGTFAAEKKENVRFIAVGQNGIIMTSPDALTWSEQTADEDISTTNLSGIAWGGMFPNNLFLITSPSGSMVASFNGLQWDVTYPTLNLYDISWIGPPAEPGRKFMGVGGSGKIIYSSYNEDGTVLSFVEAVIEGPDSPYSSLSLKSITWGEDLINVGVGRFVAVGDNGEILVSNDGISWRFYKNQIIIGDETVEVNWTVKDLNAIFWSNGLYVAVGEEGTILISEGPQFVEEVSEVDQEVTLVETWNWLEVDSGIVADLYGVTWGGGKYVAVGNGGNILYSNDGITWTHVEGSPLSSGTDLKDITWGYNYFVAVGEWASVIYSGDGVAWTEVVTTQTGTLNSVTSR